MKKRYLFLLFIMEQQIKTSKGVGALKIFIGCFECSIKYKKEDEYFASNPNVTVQLDKEPTTNQ